MHGADEVKGAGYASRIIDALKESEGAVQRVDGLAVLALVSEFASEAKNTTAVRVLTGRCSDGATAPYQPFTEILRDRFQIADFEDIEALDDDDDDDDF